jgi:hypothetical protein
MPVNTAMAKLRIGMRLKNPVFWVLLGVVVMLVIAALIPKKPQPEQGRKWVSQSQQGTQAIIDAPSPRRP